MTKKTKFRQGTYIPNNPTKYKGNVKDIVFRSSWELEFCKFCDNNTSVLAWASEEIAIPYPKPTDNNRIHRYYPDFWIKYKNKYGQIVQEVIEIKPENQKKQPRKLKKVDQNLYEQLTYAINVAKWEAATKWCKSRGIKFRIVTEKDLFATIRKSNKNTNE